MSTLDCQHIFVLECSESSKSDWNYVRKLLASKYFAMDLGRTKLTPLYLGGKTNYSSLDVKKRIDDCANRYCGKTYIHFVFDVDRGLTKDRSLNQQIVAYIEGLTFPKKAKADIIWFNKTIELVVLGRPVAEGRKVQMSEHFYTQGAYELNEKNFLALFGEGLCAPGHSNFLTVLFTSIPIGKKAMPLVESLSNSKRKHRH